MVFLFSRTHCTAMALTLEATRAELGGGVTARVADADEDDSFSAVLVLSQVVMGVNHLPLEVLQTYTRQGN